MKHITLISGGQVMVDDDDYEQLQTMSWHGPKGGYPATTLHDYSLLKMHVFLMGYKEGYTIDHKDRNTFNNQRNNLRWATLAQQRANTGPHKNSIVNYKGVYQTSRGLYKASIGLNGKAHYLGRYETAEEAAKAYDVAALKAHGEFAYLNFP